MSLLLAMSKWKSFSDALGHLELTVTKPGEEEGQIAADGK